MGTLLKTGLYILVAAALVAALLMFFADVVPPSSRTACAMHMCKRRIQLYAAEHGALPPELSAAKEIPGFNNSPDDAWGRPVVYSFDANGVVTLKSLGKDGAPGGAGENADVLGVYPSRQPDGKWSGELVEWSVDPFTGRSKGPAANP